MSNAYSGTVRLRRLERNAGNEGRLCERGANLTWSSALQHIPARAAPAKDDFGLPMLYVSTSIAIWIPSQP